MLGNALEHEPVGVPAHIANVGSATEEREYFRRERTRDHVSPRDDDVHTRRVDVLEDGLECGQVPVDVGESGDPHGERRYPARNASRGPAHTRSSAGQSAHTNSLGVGRKSPARMRAIADDSSSSRPGTSAIPKVVETTSSGRSRNW